MIDMLEDMVEIFINI